jgi:D-amino-acid oxidase
VDVTVIGGGVIGLMAAHALAHRDHAVRVLARELGDETTSRRAAASFKPSSVPRRGPYGQLLVASRRELDRWTRSGFAAELGITQAPHIEASDHPLGARDYLDVMRDVRHLSARDGDHIPGGYAYAVSYLTYFFDVPVTLEALTAHVTTAHGVTIERATITDLREVVAAFATQVLVNAAGLGARELANDPDVIPVRGQTVLVPPLATAPCSISADGFYVYPRADGIVLGGTAEHGVWDDAPDPATIERILTVNERIVPGIRDTPPIETRAGLRPYRIGGVRLELDRTGTTPIVHAYGHGGSGWTLGPGTAAWVADVIAPLNGAVSNDL